MRIFTEIQKFDQWWFRLLILILTVIIVVSITTGLSEKEFDNSLDFWIVIIVSSTSLALILAIAFLLKLYTKINEEGIYYGFWPFHNNLNLAKWSEIKKCYVRKYSPIAEYGGWGYRRRLYGKNRAYNVKGNIGIQIVFKDGRNILVGTQMGDNAQSVINRYQNSEL